MVVNICPLGLSRTLFESVLRCKENPKYLTKVKNLWLTLKVEIMLTSLCDVKCLAGIMYYVITSLLWWSFLLQFCTQKYLDVIVGQASS